MNARLLLRLTARGRRAGVFRTGLFLVFLLGAVQPQPGFAQAAPGFNADFSAQVLAAALTFMAPRILDPVPIPELTVWGLHGITAIDPSLTAELRDGSLRLVAPDRILFAEAPPPEADANAWAAASARMMQAAWNTSVAIRHAGTGGLVQSFFDELFNHLDPYSRYVPPEDASTDRENRNGDAGIGASLVRRGRAFVIADVLAGGPAADAGLRAGEQVISIDGEPIGGLEPAEVDDRIAGPDGAGIVLEIRSRFRGRPRLRKVELIRASVPPETVFESREGDLLILRVTGFASDTAARVVTELTLAMARKPAGIVIDLRGNRGGLLQQSVQAAGAVLANAIISVTVGRDPEADHLFRAEGPDLTGGIPIVALVDGRSASAAEIMAAALEDQRRAVVVGSATLGKGLVQTIAPMPGGGELFVTWSRVLAPLGWPLQGLGVMPEVCTSLGQEVLDRSLADLAQGRQDLAQALARHNAARAPLPAATIVELRSACPTAAGRDADLAAAKFLLAHPTAYQAALLPTAAGATPP